MWLHTRSRHRSYSFTSSALHSTNDGNVFSLDMFFSPAAFFGEHFPHAVGGRIAHGLIFDTCELCAWNEMEIRWMLKTTHNDDVESFPVRLRLLFANIRKYFYSTIRMCSLRVWVSAFIPYSQRGEKKNRNHFFPIWFDSAAKKTHTHHTQMCTLNVLGVHAMHWRIPSTTYCGAVSENAWKIRHWFESMAGGIQSELFRCVCSHRAIVIDFSFFSTFCSIRVYSKR